MILIAHLHFLLDSIITELLKCIKFSLLNHLGENLNIFHTAEFFCINVLPVSELSTFGVIRSQSENWRSVVRVPAMTSFSLKNYHLYVHLI